MSLMTSASMSSVLTVARKELLRPVPRPSHRDARPADGADAVPGADPRHRQHGREEGAHAAGIDPGVAGDRRRACTEPGAAPAVAEHRGQAGTEGSGRAGARAGLRRGAEDRTGIRRGLARQPQRRGRVDLRQLAPGFGDPGQARARRAGTVRRPARRRCACSTAASARRWRSRCGSRNATSPPRKPSAACCWRSCRTC